MTTEAAAAALSTGGVIHDQWQIGCRAPSLVSVSVSGLPGTHCGVATSALSYTK